MVINEMIASTKCWLEKESEVEKEALYLYSPQPSCTTIIITN